jgi:hypothetical protein
MQPQVEDRKGLNKRALTLFLLTISFILMIVSGVLLDDREFKSEFAQRIVSKVFHKAGVSMFFIISFIHIYYNWKQFLRYFKHNKFWKELLVSSAFVVIVLLVSTVYTYYH